ncbi:MAG: hypothetical protein ACOCZV_01220 [Nanoarchaeota archaeon]
MDSTGQVTIFVVLGIVLLLVVGLYVIVLTDNAPDGISRTVNDIASFSSAESQVESVVSACSKRHIESSIPYVVSSGFFATDFNNPGDDYPYYYFAGKSIFPSKQQVFAAYSSFVRDDIVACIDNFSSLTSLSGELSHDPDSVTVDAEFTPEKVVFIVDPDVSLTSDGETTRVEPVRTSLPSRIGKLYRAAEMTVYPPDHADNQFFTYPALSYLDDEGLDFNMYVTPPCNQLNFVFTDDDPLTAKDPLTLAFRFHGSCSMLRS